MVIVLAGSDAIGLPRVSPPLSTSLPPPLHPPPLHSSSSLSQFHQNQLDSPCFNLMQEPGLRPSCPAPGLQFPRGALQPAPQGQRDDQDDLSAPVLTSPPPNALACPGRETRPWASQCIDPYHHSRSVPTPPPSTVCHVSLWVVMEVFWKGA